MLRLLRGEKLDTLAREVGVTAARLSQWRDEFLAAAQAGLRSRQDEEASEVQRLRSKIGELTMEKELLFEKIHRMEVGLRPTPRRSRR